ncbi:MAG: carbohydrate kinase [Planctomycetes bacterium]|nr:carbohydrate kinase [Planctomycetota bacterium]
MQQRSTIVGLGEVLWDVFPDGPRFGGAPANFACSVAELAGDTVQACMASAVGTDDLGRQARQALQDHGVDTQAVASLPQPTGTVLVSLDGAGHASYEFASDTAWDNLAWSPALHSLASQTDAVCFGTLGQRSALSRETIRSFVRTVPATAVRVLDINLRPPYWTNAVIEESLPLANIVKLNDTELPVLAQMLGLHGSDREQLGQLVARYSLRLAALTRGAAGSLLVCNSTEFSDLPGRPTKVVDTVGAGDSFTATLVVGLLRGLPLGTINEWAGRVAAFVCSQAGATPHFPGELRQP